MDFAAQDKDIKNKKLCQEHCVGSHRGSEPARLGTYWCVATAGPPCSLS